MEGQGEACDAIDIQQNDGEDFVQVPKELFEDFRSYVVKDLVYYSRMLGCSFEFLLKNPHFIDTVENHTPDFPHVSYARAIKGRQAAQIRIALLQA